jgi:mono/diheme cytochrome c family protein
LEATLRPGALQGTRSGGKQDLRKGGVVIMGSVACRSVDNLRRFLILALLIAVGVQTSWAEDESDDTALKFSPEAAATFNKRCTACHTYGKGIKVGPDLKGVTERRKRDWLIKFIHASSLVIKSGDRTATDLFAQFKQQRMPDWTDLSEKQINDILDYVAISGPDIKPADERSAELGTAADAENGHDLFSGRKGLKYGAQACAACHSVQGTVWGGSLGPDLGKTYFKYQDRALTEFLRHPCFQWSAETPGTHYLTAKESFSLKVFLRQVALQQRAETDKREERRRSAKADGSWGHSVRAGLGDTQKGKAP